MILVFTITELWNFPRSSSTFFLTLFRIGKQKAMKNNLTLLVLHKSLPCLLIGRIPSDCRKQCEQKNTFFPRLVYVKFSMRSNARETKDGMNADECVQLDVAEDILRILFEKDLKVAIESRSSHSKALLALIFDRRRR